MEEQLVSTEPFKPLPPIDQTRDLELIVRTVNVHESDQRCPMDKDIMLPTLAGIAKKFYLDWSKQVGLIGITEPKRKVGAALFLPPAGSVEVDLPDFLVDGPSDLFNLAEMANLPDIFGGQGPTIEIPLTYTATRCMAAAIRHYFGENVSYYHNKRGGSSAKDIGVVHGREWERLDAQSRRLGIRWSGNAPDFLGGGAVVPVPDTDINWDWTRKLQMVLLRHRQRGLRLRFYCTHFSPGKKSEDRKKRASQAARVIEKVQEWTSANDHVPPILVGDFNARRVYGQPAEESIEILEKYFRRPLDDVAAQNNLTQTLIDIVWIGRRQVFPHATHDFQTLELQRIAMKDLETDSYGREYTRIADDGFLKYPLTDHSYAEGLRLRIVPL